MRSHSWHERAALSARALPGAAARTPGLVARGEEQRVVAAVQLRQLILAAGTQTISQKAYSTLTLTLSLPQQ